MDDFQDNNQAYSHMLSLVLSSLKIDDISKEKCFKILESSNALQKRKNNRNVTQNECEILTEIKNEANLFLQRQTMNIGVLKIQTMWRTYSAITKYKKKRKIYVHKRNSEVHHMLQREIGYTQLITQLAQRYAVPLLKTTDRLLKEESQDISDILRAIVDIERLHRGLLRKFRGFVDDGCDWPNIDGFGNIFSDLQEEFRAYGDFIRQFKYTIDMLDRLDLGQLARPKLSQFFEEHSYDNAGFKALLSKPLNQIASYELGLQHMADATSPEDPDFKILMKALSIISETNKYINSCLNLSYNLAEIKKMELRISIKPSQGQADLDKLYHKLVKDAQYVEEIPVEVIRKRGVKKKVQGSINFFSNMVLVSVLRGGVMTTKRLYTVPFLRVEGQQGTAFQIIETEETDDVTEIGKDVPGTITQFKCDTTVRSLQVFERVAILKEAIQANKVFGVDLNIVIDREDSELGIPLVLKTLCDYIIIHFTETVGLFRVPGSAQVEKQLRTVFNENGGEDIDLASFKPTAADVAGLIKLYFRELPRPLCGDLFIKFVEARQKFASEDQQLDMIRELTYIVNELPPNNKNILGFMCRFLKEVSEYKDINKMDCSNLAMCIGPDLMKPPVDSIELALKVPQANEALGKLVQYYSQIFEEN